jgi:DNA polymerase-3 subunit epsilon
VNVGPVKSTLQMTIEEAMPGLFERKLESWADGPYAVLDTETTGRDPREARVVQLAFAVVSPANEVLPGSFSCYLRLPPGVEMAPDAVEAHGITPERLQKEGEIPLFALADVYERIRYADIAGMPLVIYNTCYDWPLLKTEWGRYDFPHVPGWRGLPDPAFVDPLVLDRHFNRFRKGGRRLGDLSRAYGVQLENAHDAMADCLATAAVLRAMVGRYPEIRQATLRELQDRQKLMFEEWKKDMNAYFRRKGNPTVITETWPE